MRKSLAAPASARSRSLKPIWFVLPIFIIHVALVSGPSLSTLYLAFTDWNGLGNASWVGLDNFITLFTKDRVVPIAVQNNIRWMFILILVPNTTALIVALLVSTVRRGQIFLRAVYFMPYVVSAAVVGKIWSAYFNPYYGINAIFASLGWESLAETLWLGDPEIAIYAVAFVNNWHWWGFVMVLFLGALQQIDPTLYEAATVDGATSFQKLLYVSIPGIFQTICFVLIISVMWSFLTFQYVYVMTDGGPAHSTQTLATWIYYNAFTKYKAGYACALSVVQCTICLTFYFLQKYVSRKGGLDSIED